MSERADRLVIGLGCQRGTPADAIARAVTRVFDAHGLALSAIAGLASAEHKRHEPGLSAFAAQLGVPIVFYGADERASATSPNAPAAEQGAAAGVAEPAARLCAGNGRLLVPKTAIFDLESQRHITVAVARRE